MERGHSTGKGRKWDQSEFLGEYQKFANLASLIQISLARRRTQITITIDARRAFRILSDFRSR